jgi:ElaB/YqjD/DUF883 family membrane-anchored ribosome-binding protein
MTKQTATHRAVAESASGLQGIIDSADELLESLRDQQGEAVDQLRTRVAANVKSARERLRSLEVPELAGDAIDRAAGFFRASPWRMVAIGAVAAVAIALVARTASR